MAEQKLIVEIELSEETAKQFEAFVEDKCLDRDKWLKKLLADGIDAALKKQVLARAGQARGNPWEKVKEMKTEFHSIETELDTAKWPINPAVIPNHMGINLCSVEGMSWTRQEDGQLVSLTIHFLPA